MAFYVYILYSKSKDVYYKGFSENPENRLTQHLEGKSQYTSQINDWELVFIRSFESKTEALKYEKMLKRQNQNYFRWLISGELNELSKL